MSSAAVNKHDFDQHYKMKGLWLYRVLILSHKYKYKYKYHLSVLVAILLFMWAAGWVGMLRQQWSWQEISN